MPKTTRTERGAGTPMQDIIERLEKATGPDRELDEAIAIACGWSRYLLKDTVIGDELVWKSPDGNLTPCVRSFTASIDAALTLVPKGLRWLVTNVGYDNGRYMKGKAGAFIYHPISTPPRWTGFAFNEATSLCIAALKARAQASNPERT